MLTLCMLPPDVLAVERPQPPPAHSSRAGPSNAARRQPALQQPHHGGGSPASPPYPTPRDPLYSSATLGRKASAGAAPAPPTRGAGVSGARTLPRARSGAPHGSSLSAVEQLGVKSPPPSAAFGSAASAGLGGSNPVPSARGTVVPSGASPSSAWLACVLLLCLPQVVCTATSVALL